MIGSSLRLCSDRPVMLGSALPTPLSGPLHKRDRVLAQRTCYEE
jgi:hypothetical protein